MSVIGIMWNKNEEDLLPYTIPKALETDIDGLIIVDDNSTDRSYEIISSFKDKLLYCGKPPKGKNQRQAAYEKALTFCESTDDWIQIIESDVCVLETSIKKSIENFSIKDTYVKWEMYNATSRSWTHRYPDWGGHSPLDVMTFGYFLEMQPATFRALPDLVFSDKYRRPYPTGFTQYIGYDICFDHGEVRSTYKEHIPLLAHYGWRSPNHYAKRLGISLEKAKTCKWFTQDVCALNRAGIFNHKMNHSYLKGKR